MKKNKKINNFKNEISADSFRGFVNYLRELSADFKVISTGYTKTVIWGGKKFSFVTADNFNPAVFHCSKLIIDDVKKSELVIDEIPRYNINYFKINDYLRTVNREQFLNIKNVDISSAYLTTLLNSKLITPETFAYVGGQDKATRLRSVGMLATNRLVFEFENGKLNKYYTEGDKILRNYFFYLCYIVDEMLAEISSIMADKFLFYWVDGIYLKESADEKSVVDYLINKGYYSKVHIYENATFYSKNKVLYFEYVDKNVKKIFNVPFEDTQNKRNIATFLNSIKNNDESQTWTRATA